MRLASHALFLCAVTSATDAAVAQGLNRPSLGQPGGFQAVDILPDDLASGAWDAAAVPGYGIAAARADGVSPTLGDAVLVVECKDGRGGPQMSVLVLYWLDGAVTSADTYALDLFNSAISGRPASYDLGDGWVATDGIAFRMNRPPPPAYSAAVGEFRDRLAAEPAQVATAFRIGTATFTASFPTEGLGDALEMLAASEVCPP